MVTFGEWLEAELKQRGWKQADLARATNLYRQTINRVIRDERLRPDDETLQAIAKALGYDAEYVYRQAKRLPRKKNPEDRPLMQMLIEAAWELPDDELAELRAIALLKRDKVHKPSPSQ
jgi:transcriptional regulator with XRE-family HTH domain